MGHHIINEVKQEKFQFSGRAKMIAIVLFVVGAILAGVGAMNVEKHWDDVHVEHAEDHGAEAEHAEGHGDHHAMLAQAAHTPQDVVPAHSAEDAHAAEEAHPTSGHGEEAHAQLLLLVICSWSFILYSCKLCGKCRLGSNA
jgi:hypothetical protein